MGLDVHIYFVDKEDARGDFCFDNHEKYFDWEHGKTEDFYFGGFWRLNDYMAEIWKRKGGVEFSGDDDFDDQCLRLTAEDLLELKKATFFTNSKQKLVYEDEHTVVYKKVGMPDFVDNMDEDEAVRRQREILSFINLSMAAIDEGKEVYYWNNW